jgi:hypothetical protein
VKGVGPCLFFFSPCFCLLLLVYDFRSCLGNFITGVNSAKQTDQTKDYKLGMCCFFERHTALKRNSKVWLARNKNSVYEWGDMSIRGLLLLLV